MAGRSVSARAAPTRTVRDRSGRSAPGAVQRTALADLERGRLYFAQVREDPTLELAFLEPDPEGSYAVVTSGGCTALCLLAAGAGHVFAVDLNPAQNDLLELKLQAILRLDPDAVVAFLGGTPTSEDRWPHYLRLRDALTPGARAYWDANRAAIRAGVLNAGVTERFVRLFVRMLRWGVVGKKTLDEVLRPRELEERVAFYRERWDTRRWRLLVRSLLSRRRLGRTYDPAIFRGVRERDFAGTFRERIEHTLTALPPHENYFLHHMLTGAYPVSEPRGLPPYLLPDGIERIRRSGWTLEVVDGGYVEYLRRSPPAAFDGFVASNIAEWLSPAETESLFEHVARTAAPGARLCFRNFVGWTEVPERWRTRVREDRALGAQLMRSDRSVVQRRFAPCRIVSASAAVTRESGHVREARDEDDGALRALAAACPMRGDIEICAEREPSFFALTRLEGEHVDVGVIDGEHGSPVGCIAVAQRTCFVNGAPTRIAYAGDLKVHPESRDRDRADALSRWALERVGRRLGPSGVALSTVLAGNRAMERRLSGGPGLPTFTPVGTIRTYSIPVVARPGFGPRAIRVDAASPIDLEEMSSLMARVAPLRHFASALDAEELRAWIERAPALATGDYLLARRPDGSLLGFLALWDQASFKQLRVIRYSSRMRAFRRGFDLAAPLLGARRLPPAGSLLRCLNVAHLCVSPDRPEVLRALLAGAHERARRAGAHALNVGLDPAEPLAAAFRGLFAQTTDVHVFLTGASGRYEGPRLDRRPVHFEIALV